MIEKLLFIGSVDIFIRHFHKRCQAAFKIGLFVGKDRGDGNHVKHIVLHLLDENAAEPGAVARAFNLHPLAGIENDVLR
ncbi:MAG TPA: hypothetical protein DD668_05080 [Alphaproteobacteria bacterium]|nr:hypothetical protein [Alphaproteobacteria bacterium]